MKTLVAVLAAVCSSVVVATFLGLASHQLSPVIAWLSLGFGMLAGLGVYLGGSNPAMLVKWEQPGFFGWFTITVGALFAIRSFCWVAFFDGDEIKLQSPNNFGDLAIHMTYINHLASSAHFWPDDPLFAGEKLHYSIGVDLFNSLLSLCGVDIVRGIIWVGLAGCLLTGLALYRWGGPFTLAGFLFNGGTAGFLIFKQHQFLDYQAESAWKSIPLALLVTQRGFLYAFPVGLVLLAHWRDKFFKTDKTQNGRLLPAWIEVLFFSTMPLFHVHTFLFLSMMIAFWLVASPVETRLEMARLICFSLAPAAICVSLVTGMFQAHGQAPPSLPGSAAGLAGFFDSLFAKFHLPFHIKAGWMQADQPFLTFWFENFFLLPFFVMALLGVILATYRSNKDSKSAAPFVLPAALIFIFTCFVMLAPWEWDNTKVMVWCYLALLPFLWKNLLLRLPEPVRIASCLALFFSGFVSLIGGICSNAQDSDFIHRSELDSVAQAVKTVPIAASFAACPAYNHPLLLLGRNVAMGYSGHLWSHGIDYHPREAELTSLMKGETRWRAIAKRMGVRYLFWGQREEEAFTDSKKPWKQECLLVARGSWGDIYDLESPATGKLLRGPRPDLQPEIQSPKQPQPDNGLKRMPLPERDIRQ